MTQPWCLSWLKALLHFAPLDLNWGTKQEFHKQVSVQNKAVFHWRKALCTVSPPPPPLDNGLLPEHQLWPESISCAPFTSLSTWDVATCDHSFQL